MSTDSRHVSFILFRLALLVLTLFVAQLYLKEGSIFSSYSSPTSMITIAVILYSVLYTLLALLTKHSFFPVIAILDTIALGGLALFDTSLIILAAIPVFYYIYLSIAYQSGYIGYVAFGIFAVIVIYIAFLVDTQMFPQALTALILMLLGIFAQQYLNSTFRQVKQLDSEIARLKKEAGKLENAMMISEKNAKTQKELATTDYLTGLMNRSAFLRSLEQILDSAYAKDTKVGLLLIDIDHFKKYNDTYGHAIGDETLKVVSKILKDSANFLGDDTNVVARYGGEEMIVAIPNATPAKLSNLGETMRAATEGQSIALIKVNTQLVLEKPITISVGGVLWGKEDKGHDVSRDSDILINKADEALYKAKAEGRNRVIIYGQ